MRRIFGTLIGLATLVAVVAGASWAYRSWTAVRPDWQRRARGVARRTDLWVSLTAPGRVDSSEKTLIECKLENIAIGFSGQTFNLGGAATILEVIPDGTIVKKGDVLCRLDSTDYEELVRQQEIKVLQARADHDKAELDLKAAEIGVSEYREGLLKQIHQDYRGQLALLEAEVSRQAERIAWAMQMLKNGYLANGQILTENTTMLRARNEMARLKGEQANYTRYGAPLTIRRLETQREMAELGLEFQDMRLKRLEGRLEHYREQLELCTVRAPHDGMVVHANDPNQPPRVIEGGVVRQKMPLFYLPDLSRMEVQAVLNETVVDRVRAGMRVRVRVEALSDTTIEGEITKVSPLPLVLRDRIGISDVQNYLGLIRLDNSPRGLKPGMTASVEILTAHHPDALVVPLEALTVEGGRDVCYVAREDGPERREVAVGDATRDLLEVTAGLRPGEQVILNPNDPLHDPSSDDFPEPARHSEDVLPVR